MLEIERRWLTEPASKIPKVVSIAEIEQIYLEEKGSRVRKSIIRGKVTYTFTKKTYVSPGVNEEQEYEITKEVYNTLPYDNSRLPIRKQRITFNYNNQIFEFDIFDKQLQGLNILELELKDINDKVELPPFIKIIKEITKDSNYSNFMLSQKERYGV